MAKVHELHWSSKFCHCCGIALENGYNYGPKCGQEFLTRGNKSSVAHGSHLNGNWTVENHVGTATTPTTRVHAPSNKESAKLSPALERALELGGWVPE